MMSKKKEKNSQCRKNLLSSIYTDKIFIIGVTFLLFGLSMFIFDYAKTPEVKVEEQINISHPNITEDYIINICKNLSIESTASCLKNQIKKIYKYNVTDDNINLTFEELKRRGGDCRNYAFLYQKLGNALGFETTTIYWKFEKNIKGYPGHRFALICDSEECCELDLLSPIDCRKRKYENKK